MSDSPSGPARAPSSPAWQFDHLSLTAPEGARDVQILARLLALVPGSRPAFPFPGRWHYAGSQALLHVVEVPATEPAKLSHLAFRAELPGDQVIRQLQQLEVPFEQARVPETDQLQLFFRLDCGLVIELDLPLAADASAAPLTTIDSLEEL